MRSPDVVPKPDLVTGNSPKMQRWEIVWNRKTLTQTSWCLTSERPFFIARRFFKGALLLARWDPFPVICASTNFAQDDDETETSKCFTPIKWLQKHRLTRSKNGGENYDERGAVSFEEPGLRNKDDIGTVSHLGSSLDSQPLRSFDSISPLPNLNQ